MATRFGDAPPPLTDLPDTDILLQHLRVGVIVAEAPSGRFLSVNRFAEQLWEGAMPNAASVEDYGAMFTGFRPDGRQYSHDEWPLARRAGRRWLRGLQPEGHPPDAAAGDRVLAVAAGDATGTEVSGGIRVRRREQRLRVDGSPPGDGR